MRKGWGAVYGRKKKQTQSDASDEFLSLDKYTLDLD